MSTATPEIFTIFLPGEYPLPGAVAFIERQRDGYIYDFGGDKTFKPDGSLTNPYIPLLPDTGSFNGRQVARIALNPAQFIDGTYVVNYTRIDVAAKPIYSISEFAMLGGSTLDSTALTQQIMVALAPKFSAIPTATAVAQAVKSILPTTAGGSAPSANDNATALMNFQYKTVTAPGTVAAVLNSINTYATAIPGLNTAYTGVQTRIDNLATALSAQNTTINTLGTSQKTNFTNLTTTVTGLQTRMDNVSKSLAFVNSSLTNLSTNQHNNLVATNTAMATIQSQLTALTNSLNALTTTVNAIKAKVGA